MNKLFIITNESVYSKENNFYCDNLDQKITPEELSKFFEIELITRSSRIKRFHLINLKNINPCKNIFSFLAKVYRASKIENSKYLIISITPYTFLTVVLLKLLKKKSIVYLRSDGFGEYKAILGIFGFLIYKIMFSIVAKFSKFISCEDYILKGKIGFLVKPSHLRNSWVSKPQAADSSKPNLLYVGRIKVEKGIFSLINMLKNYDREFFLNIVGSSTNDKIISHKNIKVNEIETEENKLIKIYDKSNIFILPSFTEGHPLVLYEALARLRPIIVFEDIKHVKKGYEGIFISKRNLKSLSNTIDYILQNYEGIQNKMKNNKLITNKEFIDEFKDLVIKL